MANGEPVNDVTSIRNMKRQRKNGRVGAFQLEKSNGNVSKFRLTKKIQRVSMSLGFVLFLFFRLLPTERARASAKF